MSRILRFIRAAWRIAAIDPIPAQAEEWFKDDAIELAAFLRTPAGVKFEETLEGLIHTSIYNAAASAEPRNMAYANGKRSLLLDIKRLADPSLSRADESFGETLEGELATASQ